MGGKNNRVKGHKLEREVSNIFRDVLGYKNSATSRKVSKLLDDCGVDIALNGPNYMELDFILQCKMGYAKNRPKFEVLYSKIKEMLNKHLKDTKTNNAPIVLLHKLDGYKKEHFTWTWMFNDAIKFLLEYKKLTSLIKEIRNKNNKEINTLIDEWTRDRD